MVAHPKTDARVILYDVSGIKDAREKIAEVLGRKDDKAEWIGGEPTIIRKGQIFNQHFEWLTLAEDRWLVLDLNYIHAEDEKDKESYKHLKTWADSKTKRLLTVYSDGTFQETEKLKASGWYFKRIYCCGERTFDDCGFNDKISIGLIFYDTGKTRNIKKRIVNIFSAEGVKVKWGGDRLLLTEWKSIIHGNICDVCPVFLFVVALGFLLMVALGFHPLIVRSLFIAFGLVGLWFFGQLILKLRAGDPCEWVRLSANCLIIYPDLVPKLGVAVQNMENVLNLRRKSVLLNLLMVGYLIKKNKGRKALKFMQG